MVNKPATLRLYTVTMHYRREREGWSAKKMNACTHSIVQAVPAFKYERRYSIGYFTSRDLRMFSKDVTRSHIYSPITYSDLNQQKDRFVLQL